MIDRSKDESLLSAHEVHDGLSNFYSRDLLRRPVLKAEPGMSPSLRTSLETVNLRMQATIPDSFAKDYGIPAGSVARIIADLGAALVLSRLTPGELFKLGTSDEALDLFEEWERSEQRGANVTPFPPTGPRRT